MPIIAFPLGDPDDPIASDDYQENIVPFRFYFHPDHAPGQPDELIPIDPMVNPMYLLPFVFTSGAFPSGIFPSGVFPSGLFPSGVFPSGVFPSGLFASGVWPSGLFPSGVFPSGLFPSGAWPSGLFPSGMWPSGLWPSGLFPSGMWPSGLFPSGLFPSGLFPSGLWPSGLFPSGLFPSGVFASGIPLWFLYGWAFPSGAHSIVMGDWDKWIGEPYDTNNPWDFWFHWINADLHGEIVFVMPYPDYKATDYYNAREFIEDWYGVSTRERVVEDGEFTLSSREKIISLLTLEVELLDVNKIKVVWSRGQASEQTVPAVEIYKKITSDATYGDPVGTYPWENRSVILDITDQPTNIRILGANGTGHTVGFQDATLGLGGEIILEKTMNLGVYEKIYLFKINVNPRMKYENGKFIVPIEVNV